MFIQYVKNIFYKDFLLFKKYRLQVLLNYLSMFFYLFALFNFSSAIGSSDINEQDIFLSNPFFFLLSGYLIIDLTVTIINIVSSQITFYQTAGIFEEIILIRNPLLFYSSSCIFPLFLFSIRGLFYCLVPYLFFNMDFYFHADLLELIFIILSTIIFIIFLLGISLLAGSFTIVFKRGNPVIIITVLITTIFSGALYPIEALPDSFQFLSQYVPTYHFLEILRQALFMNYEPFLIKSLYILICSSLICLLSGIFIFRKAIRYSKISGKAYTY